MQKFPCDAFPYGVVGEPLFGHARKASGSHPRYASLKIEVDSREDQSTEDHVSRKDKQQRIPSSRPVGLKGFLYRKSLKKGGRFEVVVVVVVMSEYVESCSRVGEEAR